MVFSSFGTSVDKLTIQLVSNYAIVNDCLSEAKSIVLQEIKSFNLPPKEIEVKLGTTIDVLAKVLIAERESDQGRRYGHPILDLAREINRYFYPSIRYGGRGKEALASVKNETIRSFLEALDIGCV